MMNQITNKDCCAKTYHKFPTCTLSSAILCLISVPEAATPFNVKVDPLDSAVSFRRMTRFFRPIGPLSSISI